MMVQYLCAAATVVAALSSLLFSTLTYSLREFARSKLAAAMAAAGYSPAQADDIADRRNDYIFVTALARLLSNTLVLVFVVEIIFRSTEQERWAQYVAAVVITGVIGLFFSVALPHALAQHAGERLLAALHPALIALRAVLSPLIIMMRGTDQLVRSLAGTDSEGSIERAENDLQQEILAAVEEGEKEGAVDQVERTMIESVIQFRNTSVGQIMTARTEMVALDVRADLETVKRTVEDSGHSRVPVYDGSLDKIVGILYARDLLRYVGVADVVVDVRAAMRSPVYVPEVKPLKDLLLDFRQQKIHIAIVLDEYGGTAGLITIEDVLEELVGDITDEHEPKLPAMFKRIDGDPNAADVDARAYIEDLNRHLRLALPDDAGYDTLAGFVNATLGRIPEAGETFTHGDAKFTVLEAEPQRVIKLRIEPGLAAAAAAAEAEAANAKTIDIDAAKVPVDAPAA